VNIKPEEIDSIKVCGELNGSPVKLIKTIGGFFTAVGARTKHSKNVEPLSAGSHPALIMHQLDKEFKSEFKPAIMKSEGESLPIVKEYTHKLPHGMVEKGYNLYSLTKNNDINFVATKHGAELINIAGYTISGDISNLTKITAKAPAKETAKICAVIAEVLNG
jgi:hypothetical protein